MASMNRLPMDSFSSTFRFTDFATNSVFVSRVDEVAALAAIVLSIGLDPPVLTLGAYCLARESGSSLSTDIVRTSPRRTNPKIYLHSSDL